MVEYSINQQENQYELDIRQEDIVDSIYEYYQEDLRPHQIEALEFMNDRNKGVIQCFCGTGKSRIIYEKTMSYCTGNILLIFPSLALVQQFNDQYLSDIQETSQIVICDSKHIKSIQEEHFGEEQNIFLTTYMSLGKFQEYFYQFDLVIFDEAHHICTKNILNLIQEIEDADIFFFTATPKIAKKLLNMYQSQDEMEESKDITDNINLIDCGEMFVYDFYQALQDGYIVDYELHHCIYQPTTDIIQDQFNALVQFAQIHKRTRVIAFNQFIDKISDNKTSSMRFLELSSDKVQIKIISASTAPYMRDNIFKWFQEEDYDITKIIFNASCIKEGIDLPRCDLVVFCDDKQSPINIIQCIGRATRLSNNKDNAMITAMIPLDLEQTVFKIITNICKALKRVDFRMKDIFSNKQIANFVKFTCIDIDNKNIYTQFTNKVIVSLLNSEQKWETMYVNLRVFIQQYNRYPHEKSKNDIEKKLGQWVTTNKTKYRLRQLDQQYIQQLETLDKWQWQKQISEQWMKQYYELKHFYETFGRQPSQAKINEIELNQWVTTNKMLNKYIGSRKITQHKKELLNKLSLWQWDVDFDSIWENHYKSLVTFRENNLGLYPIVNQKQTETKDSKLAIWISVQKRLYLRNKLSDYRIQKLQQLENWIWKIDLDQQWMRKYQALKQFLMNNNNIYPSSTSKDDLEKQLHRFVGSQRASYVKGIGIRGGHGTKLTKERVQLLDLLPEWEWYLDLDKNWNEQYQKLKGFLKINKLYPTQKTEKVLSNWISSQRRAHKGIKNCSRVTQERTKLLEELPDWQWDQSNKPDQWNHIYIQLQQFLITNNYSFPREKNGNELEQQLGKWISRQRQKYNNDLLSPQNIQQLESITGWQWNPLQNQWNIMFNKLKDYLTINDFMFKFDKNDPEQHKIESWVIRQRSAKRGNKNCASLNQDQIDNLESLKGWNWNPLEISKNNIQGRIYSQSLIKNIHKIAFISNLDKLYQRFQNSPKELIDYHEQREKKQQTKPKELLPHNIITDKIKCIKNKSNIQIIDLGCGLNKIAENMKDDNRFQFTSIDMIKLDNAYGNVQQGNIADLCQFADCTFKYAIMSLCFWGKDFEKSIKECYRILEDPGVLYIIQTKKKMEGFDEILSSLGFMKRQQEEHDKYYYMEYRK